jgi:predicted nucleic acid-binding protein
MTVFPIVAADPKAVETALEAAGAERLSYWDAVLLATLARAGCTTLLSEDMQDGATAAGVLVRNPFAGDELPEAVARLLGA